MYETLLRYPGGKTRAVKHLIPYLPSGGSLVSPFFGGGSLELAWLSQGSDRRVYGYDLFEPLVCFWQYSLSRPKDLAEHVRGLFPVSRELFYQLQQDLEVLTQESAFVGSAIVFYILNRCSFSGSTLSGGMSPGHPRFTLKGIEKLSNWSAPELTVDLLDFRESIPRHPDEFMYLDPPYWLPVSKLYGVKGSHHKDFDHLALFELLKDRDHWLLSYNDCPEIREMYQGFPVITPEWAYGMGSNKKSKEVLIFPKNYEN